MNFLSMEYFLVVVEEGSFSHASGKLFVSQQSLSEHVKKLEDELGAPLLKRGRPLTLTVAGEVFYDGVRKILSLQHQMLQEITLVTTKRRSKITIGIATFDSPPFLPTLLAQFAIKYPQYEANVVKRLVTDISHNMTGVDLYFSWLPLDPNLEHIMIMENDEYAAVFHKDLSTNIYAERWPKLEHKLLETGDLSLLKELPFIMLYDKNGILSRDLDLIFQAYHLSPAIGFQSENGDLNAEMSTNGVGVFIAPYHFCRQKLKNHFEKPDSPLRIYKIKTPGLKCALALSYEKGKRLHPAEHAFIGLTREVLAALPSD